MSGRVPRRRWFVIVFTPSFGRPSNRNVQEMQMPTRVPIVGVGSLRVVTESDAYHRADGDPIGFLVDTRYCSANSVTWIA